MKGAIYVAFGAPARKCLQASAYSLQTHEPGIEILAVTDGRVSGVRTTRAHTQDVGARSIKTQLPEFIPPSWDRVVYMDVDTIVLKPLDRFWRPLDRGWDMVMCRDETAALVRGCRLKHSAEMRYTISSLGTVHVPQFAGGLIAWVPNERTNFFFSVWYAEWLRYRYRDQGALTRALAAVPLRMWPLEYQANASKHNEAVEVWHKHGTARQRGAQ